jgi:lipopolysaccharide export system permease protein
MGSIDKYIFRTTLASLARVAVNLAAPLRIARVLAGIDPATRHWMILALLGFDSRTIPSFAIGRSNARLLRLSGRAVAA